MSFENSFRQSTRRRIATRKAQNSQSNRPYLRHSPLICSDMSLLKGSDHRFLQLTPIDRGIRCTVLAIPCRKSEINIRLLPR